MLPYHSLPFCLWIKVMDPRLILYHYNLSRKVCGSAWKRLRRSVQASTRTFFCSLVNILGTQRADTFLIPKSAYTIGCTVLQLMLCVKHLSLFNTSLII